MVEQSSFIKAINTVELISHSRNNSRMGYSLFNNILSLQLNFKKTNMKDCGLIHVYTGGGKGKTTAAVGLAARAVGGGLKVCYVSFHKRPDIFGYKEMQSLTKLGVEVINRAQGHPHLDTTMDCTIIANETLEAVAEIKQMVIDNKYDMLILDEILISVRDKFLQEQVLIDFIESKPANLELVLTGRNATEKVMEMAHYVTFMDCKKHPYETMGIESRLGIEF